MGAAITTSCHGSTPPPIYHSVPAYVQTTRALVKLARMTQTDRMQADGTQKQASTSPAPPYRPPSSRHEKPPVVVDKMTFAQPFICKHLSWPASLTGHIEDPAPAWFPRLSQLGDHAGGGGGGWLLFPPLPHSVPLAVRVWG